MGIYLDNAATSTLSDSTKEYLVSILNCWGNPSSLHSQGTKPKQIISDARQSVAKFINANSRDLYFTPSGSASNTLAIHGYYAKHNCTILYSPITHKSILKCVESYKNSQPLNVDHDGTIDIHDLEECLDACISQPFVIIDHANSEIGTIQNIQEIIRTVHLHNGIIYLDCTGSIPQIPVNVKSLDADMIGFSGHKLGGLKGCGILYKKKNIDLEPLVYGSQEQGYIGGTENVLGIASLGRAFKDYDYSSISSVNRDYVYDYIVNNIQGSYLVGASIESGNRLPHNLYMCFKGIEGESLMILLDMNGIQVSTGSACNSKSISASTTLSAIGMNKKDIHSCIRLTFSGQETKKELDYVCHKLKECVETLRRINTQ
ncbi:MAG: aminotransferase class V-fold PLP-dependent enzyme [Lachnospiraceae bacterium]|nr:aminotransferase class V-fold PLP-dependent enzyme [Lachnospiraceae bacterium]